MSIVVDCIDDIAGMMVSRNVHDQGDSYLCWVYAFATSFSNSVRRLVSKLHKSGKISNGQKKRCFNRMNEANFHRRLRMEITMVIPTTMDDGPDQTIKIRAAMIRVCLAYICSVANIPVYFRWHSSPLWKMKEFSNWPRFGKCWSWPDSRKQWNMTKYIPCSSTPF